MASRIERLKTKLDEFKDSYCEEYRDDELLYGDLEINEKELSISFKVDPLFEGGFTCSLLVPDSYPKGEYTFTHGEDVEVFRGQSIYEVLEKCFSILTRQREKYLETLMTPKPEDGENHNESIFDDDDDEGEGELSPTSPIVIEEFSFGLSSSRNGEGQGLFDSLVDEVNTFHSNGWFARKGASGIDSIRIYIYFDPNIRLQLKELVANCWGIDLTKYICISLTFSSYFLGGSVAPEVESFQCGNTFDRNLSIENRSRYGLSWTVDNRLIGTFFKKTNIDSKGRVDGENFLLTILLYAERTIRSSPYYCLVCGEQMLHVGVKPAVCSRSLCIFSHEQYGLGCDLESEIINHGEVVDLLVTMTVAAAAAPIRQDFNPFDPFPMGIEVKKKNRLGKIQELHFRKNGKVADNRAVLSVAGQCPNIQTLQEYVRQKVLKKRLDALDCRLYPLLRWIVSSNRCHLHLLSKQDQNNNMKTEHQYLMMSGTPEKEAEFQDLKRKYGAILAWHGSPLYNWHGILRKGLKNMSGTKGQLHGAAYGKGVYFAAQSGTSCSYMKFHSGWANSRFHNASLGMMALCEIINHPNYKSMPNPYYVIPEDKHIQTRILFVYPSHTSTTVTAKSYKLPNISWW